VLFASTPLKTNEELFSEITNLRMLDFPYSKFLTLSSYFLVSEKVQEFLNRKKGTLWSELNYSLLSLAGLC
jgi:hypothetical protein